MLLHRRRRAFPTSTGMIAYVSDEELAQRVAEVLMQQRAPITVDIDTTICRSLVTRHVISTLKQSQPYTTHSVLNF